MEFSEEVLMSTPGNKKRDRQSRTPITVSDVTPTPNTKWRPTTSDTFDVVAPPSPDASRVLFADPLTDLTPPSDVSIDSGAPHETDTTTESRRIRELEEELRRLREAHAAPLSHSTTPHEVGVLDSAAKQCLTRCARTPKIGDGLFAIQPMFDNDAWSYTYFKGSVTNVENNLVSIEHLDLLGSNETVTSSLEKNGLFCDEAKSQEAMCQLNDRLSAPR